MKLYINLIIPSIVVIGIFLNQKIFYLIIFVLVIVQIKEKFFSAYILTIPIILYFSKIFFALSDNQNMWNKFSHGYDSYFIDLTKAIRQTKCNFLSFEYGGLPFVDSRTCPSFQGYGPLFNSIKSNYLNTDIMTNLFVILFFLATLAGYVLIYRKKIISRRIQFFIFLSPSFNLLINQQNLDLVLFILFLYAVLFAKNNVLILILTLVSALFKIHPTFALIGFLIYAVKNKKESYIFFSFSALLFSSYLILIENITPLLPTGPHNATGLLSVSQYIWITLFDRAFGYRLVIFILFFLMIAIYFLGKSDKYNLINLESSLDFSIFIWTFSTFLIANYDYRNMILILYIIKFSKQLSILEINIFIAYLYLSPFHIAFDGYLLHLLTFSKALIILLILGHFVNNLIKVFNDILHIYNLKNNNTF